MNEDQLLQLRPGDIVHIPDIKNEVCRSWTIDFKTDKYAAHAVHFPNKKENPHRWYGTMLFPERDRIELIHLPEECQRDG